MNRAASPTTSRPRTAKAQPKILKPKIPKRQRGKLRVSALLEAGAAVFTEKGFDVATMTEIADRAGASIGSLYQFFPTKESMADTLRAQYGDSLCAKLATLRASVKSYSAEALATRLIEIDIDTLAMHPSFGALMVVRGRTGAGIVEVRQRLAKELELLIAAWSPQLTSAETRVMAIVLRQILRAVIDFAVQQRTRDRSAILEQMRLLLALYLKSVHGRNPSRRAQFHDDAVVGSSLTTCGHAGSQK